MNQQIKKMANYCASCVIKPCQLGCPLHNDITSFIKCIKEDKYYEAYHILCQTTVLPAICGRVCPYEKQCEGSCVKGVSSKPVAIGELEAFIGDMSFINHWSFANNKINKRKEKVAIIGGGPSGLTCASFLAQQGINVTIYEKHNYLGGLLYHGIPDFRLDKEILKKTIDKILELDIKVKCNQELGKDFSLEDLEKEYDAIFLGIGANVSKKMNITGENLDGVYGGNELLETKLHPNYCGKIVAVIGGGNVAMDVARTIKRLGAKKVYVIYRRSEHEMPAFKSEVEATQNEDIEFLYLHNVVKIIGQQKVEQIELIKTKVDDKLNPVNIKNSNYCLNCDYVIMAIGSRAQEDIVSKLGLNLTNNGKIKIDSEGHTSKEKIFSGGDLANARGTVAWASRTGRNAAMAIIEYLNK